MCLFAAVLETTWAINLLMIGATFLSSTHSTNSNTITHTVRSMTSITRLRYICLYVCMYVCVCVCIYVPGMYVHNQFIPSPSSIQLTQWGCLSPNLYTHTHTISKYAHVCLHKVYICLHEMTYEAVVHV